MEPLSPADLQYRQVYTQTSDAVLAVAATRGRPVSYVDGEGYTLEILAAIQHPDKPWNVCFERRAKSFVAPSGHPVTDVRIWVSAEVEGETVYDTSISSYNPYFGCDVLYLGFHADTLISVYSSKAHTYALRLCLSEVMAMIDEDDEDAGDWDEIWDAPELWEGWGDFRRIEDEWAIVGNCLVALPFATLDRVEVLRIDETAEVRQVTVDEARSEGCLPRDFDAVLATRTQKRS